MMWWRVEFDKSGAIVGDVRQVEASTKGSAHICYVQASSKAEACVAAKLWCARRNATQAARIERKRASGTCTRCSNPARDGKRTCQDCAEVTAEAHRRRLSVAPTTVSARTPEQQFETTRARNLEHSRKHNAKWPADASRMFKCLRKLDELSPEQAPAFREWLVAEIAARTTDADWIALYAPDSSATGPGVVRIPPGKRAKRQRIDWFESSLANAAE